eukprot:TRINITY_DN5673_c0_g4_i1.p1 TRINITY_DN5673_c0_g4~~TRINITY_DN5673_c0_g4_i1.p1  ORF type:complete len:446 (-),score=88.66 TRINITY_DN5673_c0_g4_i1:206-1543(-)
MGNLVCGTSDKKNVHSRDDDDDDDEGDEEEQERKLLLLGPEHSGRATILKQMKILHLGGFTNAERLYFKRVILDNLFRFMGCVLDTANRFDIRVPSLDRGINNNNNKAKNVCHTEASNNVDETTRVIIRRTREEVERLLTSWNREPELEELLDIVQKLWKHNRGVRETIERFESEMFPPISASTAAYFFNNLSGLASESNEDFFLESSIPTDDDVLRCSIKATSTFELKFTFRGRNFAMMDVRGSRTERRKWIHCIDIERTPTMVFCADISDYDRVLYEDNRTKRLQETLNHFGYLCDCRWFENSAIVLLLNKTDLLREKIAKTDLRVCFPDYEGGSDFNKACQYIRDKFLSLNKLPNRPVNAYFLSAIDTNQVRNVFDSIASQCFCIPITLVDKCCSIIGRHHTTEFLTTQLRSVVPQELHAMIMTYHQHHLGRRRNHESTKPF